MNIFPDHVAGQPGGGALLLALACAFAQLPAQTSRSLARLAAADASQLLQNHDPVVSGEAVLLLAAAGADGTERAALELATAPQRAARQRAILALGVLATPVAVQWLEQQLLRPAERGDPDAVVAAYALGLVPPDATGSAVARILASSVQGSLKRQHDALLALMIAHSRHAEPGATTAMRQLFYDDSCRDPQLRALLLDALLRAGNIDDRQQWNRFARGNDAERLVWLRWIADQPATRAMDCALQLSQVASRGRSAGERALALDALTNCRYQPALDAAARSLEHGAAGECGAGLRAVLALGGARAYMDVERIVRDEREPGRLAALLEAYPLPPSAALGELCARLGADRTLSLGLRVAAATALARTDADRAAPLLRDLFRLATDTATANRLAMLLHNGGELVPLEQLFERPGEISRQPVQWRALLHVGNPAAQRLVLAALGAPGDAGHCGAALGLWRRVVLPLPAAAAGVQLPAVVKALID